MRVVYARQRPAWLLEMAPDYLRRNSLFLGGPTPRLPEVPSWRPEALEMLELEFVFNGVVMVPEDPGFHLAIDVDSEEQINWEYFGTECVGCNVFWIPRDLVTMPGFTTNIEFGRYLDSGKIVVGAPQGAQKMGYIRYWCQRNQIPYSETLKETLANAIAMLGQ